MYQDVPCYSCGSIHHAPYLVENGFELVKCPRCGLLYVTPRPIDAAIGVDARAGRHLRSEPDWPKRFDNQLMRDLAAGLDRLLDGTGSEPWPDKLTWLDIGAKNGEMLEAVRSALGARVAATGLEPDLDRAAAARRRGLDVTCFDLIDHGGRYDVISAIDVFSHLPDPRVDLESWSSLLNAGGRLILRTCDTTDLPSFDHPRPLHLPDHLSFADETIVTSILTDIGFTVERIFRQPLINWTPSVWLRELARAATPGRTSRLRSHEVTRRPLTMMVLARLG